MKKTEKVRTEKIGTEKIGTEMAGREKVGTEMAGREKVGTEMTGREKVGTEMTDREKVGTEMAGREKVGTEMTGREKVGTEMTGREKVGTEMAGREKVVEEMAGREKVVEEMADREKIEREKVGSEKVGTEMVRAEKGKAEGIRIKDAFDHGTALIGFVTGGDPSMDKSEEYILKMAEAGCDLIEIGIPFSDPIAEGPAIQKANFRALSAGATTDRLFGLAARVREKTHVPLVFLTYLNPVFRYGYEAFCAKCSKSGINGIIIPDMPFEEKGELLPFAEAHGVELIPLIAPAPGQRVERIAAEARGFACVVSSMEGTGSESNGELVRIFAAVRASTDVPVVADFGVGTPEQAAKAARLADGVAVGSGVVELIAQYGEEAGEYVYGYVKQMKEAVRRRCGR